MRAPHARASMVVSFTRAGADEAVADAVAAAVLASASTKPSECAYSQFLLARNPRCKKLSLALFQSGAKKLN